MAIKPPIRLTEKEHDLIRSASLECDQAQAAARQAAAIAQGKQEKLMAIIETLGTRYQFPAAYKSLQVRPDHVIEFQYDIDVHAMNDSPNPPASRDLFDCRGWECGPAEPD